MDADLLTPEEVATQLRVKPATIRAWCRSGRLVALRVGKQWRVRRDSVELLLSHRKEAS